MSKTYINVALHRLVIERANNCCEYCLLNQADHFFSFQIDHVIDEKHGGSTDESNLCFSCSDCNSSKGSDISAVDWSQGKVIVPLFNPREQMWSEHFEIDLQTAHINPLTAIRRVTVFLLQLNNDERVTDRLLLIRENRYPTIHRSSS